uniref:Uncharacterized protein n=1 Tax=Timema genevievae TaxID=629358 RepID=A0A7R9PKL5_TIMGE|nr:unnamed protein product [Timema genevievae]
MAEEQLDQALSQVCKHFDADHYSKVHSAYKLLGKMQMAMDQMHMHFASAIHNSAFNVVHGYVELCFVQTHGEDPVILHKKQFRELCKFVTAESFIPCLLDLCKALWEIMKSYHKVIIWQQRNDSDKLTADGAMENVDFEASFNKEYVKQKLENGLARIWQDVQSRISVYLLGSDLAWYKFDEFLQVLGIVHRLMEVGEEFCGSKSTDLQNSIRTQSMNYFINYHQSRLDELRIFLENEGWEICPVKPNFTILRLQEFGSLRHILKYWKNDLSSQGHLNMSSPECSSNHSQDDSSLSGGYFARYSDSGSPFDISQDEVQEEDILANIGLQDEPSGYFSDESDEDIPEELTKDFVDENMGDTVSNKHSKPTSKKNIHVELLKAPILTNTALTVLRQCGKYLQMSHLLRPIACDVITCMSQLFEYYLYTVYSFFANDLPVSCHSMFSLKLQATLKRIKDKLILSDQDQEQKPSEINKRKILPPQMSTGVEMNQAESLYGLAERVVAVESLVFLAKQFKFLQSYLEHLIPHNSPVTGNSAPLHHFYSQTILVATELRRPVYMNVCARAVDFNTTLNSMAKVNWEVKEVMSQHSQYVDNLLRDLQIFSMRLEEVSCRVPLSPDILNILWENVAYLCCNTFVEGSYQDGVQQDDGWKEVIERNLKSLKSNKARELVYPAPGVSIIESRWVFTEKMIEGVTHKETCLVAKSYQQPPLEEEDLFHDGPMLFWDTFKNTELQIEEEQLFAEGAED